MSTRGRILLLDDDDALRHAVGQGLELEGFTVETFARGQALLDRVERDDEVVHDEILAVVVALLCQLSCGCSCDDLDCVQNEGI